LDILMMVRFSDSRIASFKFFMVTFPHKDFNKKGPEMFPRALKN
jgi:hypothetical protein